MNYWFWGLGLLYVSALVGATFVSRRQTKSADDYMLAGSNLGVVVGCLTVAATLFSTFTLLGMPDFFRTHGIGSWIFMAVADAAMAFVIIWFGTQLRAKAKSKGFKGISGLMRDCYQHKAAGWLYLIGVFIFLVPYVAIQIRGIGVFLNAAFPLWLPIWGWAILIVVVMITYSELGGLKAIILADAMQGLILLSVTVVIAWGCVTHFGSVSQMFAEQKATLLSVPGPQGLFTQQFLVASFLVFILIPVTQPQMSVRLVIMKDQRSLHQMAFLLGVFAIVLVAAIVPIGMYGAVVYQGASTEEFLAGVLIQDQTPFLAAAAAIGLIAAAISTADSQLFALGNEVTALRIAHNQAATNKDLSIAKVAIMLFALASLLVAIFSGNQFVMLARVSFAGTAMLAPMILAAIMTKHKPGIELVVATAAAMLLFIASLLSIIPETVAGIRLDLALLVGLALIATVSCWRSSITSTKMLSDLY